MANRDSRRGSPGRPGHRTDWWGVDRETVKRGQDLARFHLPPDLRGEIEEALESRREKSIQLAWLKYDDARDPVTLAYFAGSDRAGVYYGGDGDTQWRNASDLRSLVVEVRVECETPLDSRPAWREMVEMAEILAEDEEDVQAERTAMAIVAERITIMLESLEDDD